MTRRIIGPFNRVEGDLEVRLEMDDTQVSDAWVVSPLYRGFEQMLHGKLPDDAMTYVPRICGICSVAQSVAAAKALADAQNVVMPLNGELCVNLISATENIADHLTHFYLFFMPDFARETYQKESWFQETEHRFKATQGHSAQQMLPARAQFMHLMGFLAGKWPHTLSIMPGGTTRSIRIEEKIRIQSLLHQFRQFLENQLFGDNLDTILSLQSVSDLNSWHKTLKSQSDFIQFLNIADALNLADMGRASDRFMSYGAYASEGSHLLAQGVWYQGEIKTLDTSAISEDVSHSWMLKQDEPKHPFNGSTRPDPEMESGYTWCKAPRLNDEVVEVGALARQLVNKNPLITELVMQSGGNVRNRVIGRLLEMAQITLAMQNWAKAIQTKQDFCAFAEMPAEAEGIGLTEAARGSLGHWLKVKNGRILNYQIVAPTTWNFSPRDRFDVRGPLEQALIGAPVRHGETNPISVQHIVRSFDPCMVCTVH